MGQDDQSPPTNRTHRKATAKHKPPIKSKPSADHDIGPNTSLLAHAPKDEDILHGPTLTSAHVPSDKRGKERAAPPSRTPAIDGPHKNRTSKTEPPSEVVRKAGDARTKVDSTRQHPGEPVSRKRKRAHEEDELPPDPDDDDDQPLAHSLKNHKRKYHLPLVVSDSEPERQARSHKQAKTKSHTAAHMRISTAADDNTMVDTAQPATDKEKHAAPKPKAKSKGNATSNTTPGNLKFLHCLGLANKLPNNWKDEPTRSAHLEPLRIGILITQALYEKARLTIEMANFLQAQDDRAAQEHARQGLPPPPPLLTRRALVELRNELIGILAPDPSQELMGGAYKRYRIDTSALEYANDSPNEIVRIPCLATKRSSTPTDDAGDDDVEPLGLTPPHTVGRPMDEDDRRYAVAEDTQQGSSDAESYTRWARYASPEVPYIGQAVAEDHSSQQSYAPSTSQE